MDHLYLYIKKRKKKKWQFFLSPDESLGVEFYLDYMSKSFTEDVLGKPQH